MKWKFCPDHAPFGLKEMQVNIIEKYNTTLGMIVVVPADRIYHIGDQILLENQQYTISKIILPTRPPKDETVSLVVV